MPTRFDLSALSRRRSAQFVLAFLASVVAISSAAFAARAWRDKNISAPEHDAVTALPNPAHGRWQHRLALRPEADRLRRRLGRRFSAPGRELSVLTGTLILGSDRQTVRIARSQDDGGERVMIALNGGQPTLSWSGMDGAWSDGDSAAGDLHKLIERIALDSPDQFVLAQLRGASYFKVASNVRPAEAGASDDYKGPVWDVVRVGEPPHLTENKPRSPWRLFYINTATGLIDKALSREDGETVIAEFSDWVEQDGERTPRRISWTRDKQVVMELKISNIGHGPKQ